MKHRTVRVEDRPVGIVGELIGDIVGGNGEEKGYEVSLQHRACRIVCTLGSQILQEVKRRFAELEMPLKHLYKHVHGANVNCSAAIVVYYTEDADSHLAPGWPFAQKPFHIFEHGQFENHLQIKKSSIIEKSSFVRSHDGVCTHETPCSLVHCGFAFRCQLIWKQLW